MERHATLPSERVADRPSQFMYSCAGLVQLELALFIGAICTCAVLCVVWRIDPVRAVPSVHKTTL